MNLPPTNKTRNYGGIIMGQIIDISIICVVGLVKIILLIFIIGFYMGLRYKDKQIKNKLTVMLDGLIGMTQDFKGTVSEFKEKVVDHRNHYDADVNSVIYCDICKSTVQPTSQQTSQPTIKELSHDTITGLAQSSMVQSENEIFEISHKEKK